VGKIILESVHHKGGIITCKSSKTNINYQGAGRFMKYNQIISLLKSNAETYLFILPFSLFILIKKK